MTDLSRHFEGVTARLYYEAHITLDLVPEVERPQLEVVLVECRFKLAKLLMQKGSPSMLDTFATGHGKDLEEIITRTAMTVHLLRSLGYVVRRYKIEDTVMDSRIEDVYNLL